KQFALFMIYTPQLAEGGAERVGLDTEEESIVLIKAMSNMCHFSLGLLNNFSQIIERSLAELTSQKRGILDSGNTVLQNSLTKIQTQLQELRSLAEPLVNILPVFTSISQQE